jgi:hypothetical protein
MASVIFYPGGFLVIGPRYLIRDRAAIYGVSVALVSEHLGSRANPSRQVLHGRMDTLKGLIGNLGRECVDHLIVLGEATPISHPVGAYVAIHVRGVALFCSSGQITENNAVVVFTELQQSLRPEQPRDPSVGSPPDSAQTTAGLGLR